MFVQLLLCKGFTCSKNATEIRSKKRIEYSSISYLLPIFHLVIFLVVFVYFMKWEVLTSCEVPNSAYHIPARRELHIRKSFENDPVLRSWDREMVARTHDLRPSLPFVVITARVFCLSSKSLV